MKQYGFRHKILLLAVALVVTTQLVMLFPVLDLIKRDSAAQAERTVSLAGVLFEEYMHNREETLLRTANLLVSDFPFKQAVASVNDEATIRSLLHNHASRVDASVAALLDLEGNVGVSSTADGRQIPSFPKVSIAKWGNRKNVRFEARPKGVKRGNRWSWDDNPFKATNEFAGLRIMMAMLNNWDLKDENTVILEKDGKSYYAISDLGYSFGKLARHSGTRSGRSVNEPEHYADATFIKAVDGQMIQFNYTAQRADLMQGINVQHGRWLADLLLQLSDKQIQDAFRAANYKPEEIALLTASFKARIAELDKHTQVAVANN